jgi:hypothetical protein
VLVVVQDFLYIDATETVTADDEAVGFVEKVVLGKVVIRFLTLFVQLVEDCLLG